MKKTIMCILMCSLLACSAVSCGSKDSSSSANSKKTVVPELSDEQKANMKAVADKMNEERKKSLHNTDEMDEEAKKVAKSFSEAVYEDDAETMAKAMYPPKMLEAMKKCGEYDSFVESVVDGETSTLSSVEIKFCVKLKENEIELAKSYLNYYAKQYGLTDTEYNVTAGYSFMADATSRAGKVIKSAGTSLIVVNIENEGWKIIPVSIKELTE